MWDTPKSMSMANVSKRTVIFPSVILATGNRNSIVDLSVLVVVVVVVVDMVVLGAVQDSSYSFFPSMDLSMQPNQMNVCELMIGGCDFFVETRHLGR